MQKRKAILINQIFPAFSKDLKAECGTYFSCGEILIPKGCKNGTLS